MIKILKLFIEFVTFKSYLGESHPVRELPQYCSTRYPDSVQNYEKLKELFDEPKKKSRKRKQGV